MTKKTPFEFLNIPSRYRSTRSADVPFGTTDNPPDRKNPIKGTVFSLSTQFSKIPNT